MTNEKAGCCPEDEHDWCEIPLHEADRVCAKCGEIREALLVPARTQDDGPAWQPAAGQELTSVPNY